MASSPKRYGLDRLALQQYVGLSSYQKGEEYALNKAIMQGKLKHHVLTALCQGHEFDPYRVEVIFNAEGIQQSYCSCPVGAGGRCKHIAALLLTWMEDPDAFSEWENMKGQLQAFDASTLIELIDLLEDKVKNSAEVMQGFYQHLQQLKSPRLAKYIRRIEEAFQVSTFPWYHADEGGLSEIAFALDKIRSDLDQLVAEKQIGEAVYIDQMLIQHILHHLDDHFDPWGNLSEELKRCVQSLDHLLTHTTGKEELRQKIFRLLFRLIEEQLHRTINVRAEEAKQVILKHIQPHERAKMVAWIESLRLHQAMQKEHEALGLEDFLIDLQREVLDPALYLSHYRQTGQVVKLVDSLLALQRIEEAQEVAQQKEGTLHTLALAQLFVKYHQAAIAERLVLHFTEHHPDLRALRWLKDFYQTRGALALALEQAKKILYFDPQFSHYQKVQELSQQLHQWPVDRQEIFRHFEALPGELLLIEMYLDEKLWDQAIKAFTSFSQFAHHPFQETRYTLLALRLADATRSQHPLFSLKVYQEMAEHVMQERNRESYRRACDYLRTIRSIYEELQQKEEWESYLRTFIQTYQRLKAFKEELHHAQLLPSDAAKA